MRFARGFLVLLALALALEQAAPVHPQADPQAALFTFEHDGLTRTYRLYVPANHDAAQPVPLLFALHGGGGNSRSMERLTEGGFNRLADAHDFLVVYPDGLNQAWNDGRLITGQASDADDVGFLLALLDDLATRYAIDPARVFATGISNGGAMSFRLACDAADRFAAVAPVAMNFPVELARTCTPAEPVALLMITGMDDPIVPYGGGPIRVLFSTRGEVMPAAESAAWWAVVDGCGAAESAQLADAAPDDGTSLVRTVYQDCAPGAVTLLTVTGGGHTWPGGWQYFGERLIGRTSREIDASAVIWDFFAGLSRVP
ncbi:MAG: prolyl oligopeptidase family serine peptidase [Anaerolineae bacterium]|nr:prolyl oligopeptidase family serine peptidase [Anaerolineae bacterium]